jgi:hypothetical protein
MDAPERTLSADQIEITLKGFPRPILLRATPGAAIRLCRKHGGVMPLSEKLAAYDIEAFIDVLAIAGGIEAAGMALLPEAIIDAGMVHLSGPLTKYCVAIAGGSSNTKEDADPSR